MQLFGKKETPYDKSKEFLNRQQKIDYLLVLAKLIEPGMQTGEELTKLANKKIEFIIEDLSK